MYCEMCGAVNDDNAKVCKKCGFSFTSSSKNSQEDFEKKTDKFIKDNNEKIRSKSVVEVGATSAKKVAKKIPLGGKIVIVAVLIALVGFGIYYYIMTNNFFVQEKNEKTGETYYVYYKNGYKVLDTDLYLRGNYYRVDHDGHRIEDDIYIDPNGNEYYYDKDGILQAGKWFKIDGVDRYANQDGIIVKNEWVDKYYLDNNGDIARNRPVQDYFVDENGHCVISEWKNEHYYGEDGKILRSTRTPDNIRVDRDGNIMPDPTSQVFDKNFQSGATIVFGEFEQDGDESNGPEPIEWYLLHGHQEEAYLISKYVLFVNPYQEEKFANEVINEWDKSYLKQWLEGYFYNLVFDDIDKHYVLKSDNGLVFAPSEHELDLYMPKQASRMSVPTQKAIDATKFSKEFTSFAPYWLRDNGVNAMHKKFVSDTGEVISDDVSPEIMVTNQAFSKSVSGFAGTEAIQDRILRAIAKKLIGQIPFLGDLLNDIGATDELFDMLAGFLGKDKLEEQIEDMKKSFGDDDISDDDIDKELGEIIVQNPEKRKMPNPYLNAGLVTNQYMGVRPMLILDMDVNKK